MSLRTPFPEVILNGIGLETDAAFALLKNREAVLVVGGRDLQARTPDGDLRIVVDQPATLRASWGEGKRTHSLVADIEYETRGGLNHTNPPPSSEVHFEDASWKPSLPAHR